MNLLAPFLNIVEAALRNPQDKAAVQIAIDGLAAWREVSSLASVKKLEADIGIYVALLPASPAPVEPTAALGAQEGYRGGSRGGLLPPGV